MSGVPARRSTRVIGGITRRPAGPDDMEFLYTLFEAALGPHLVASNGPWRQREERARFFETSDPADHEVVELDGRPVGCLKVRWLLDEVRLDRVFVLPAHQNRGIGSRLVEEILAEARARALPVRLRVLVVNPARSLYERLGFTTTGESDTHVLMERAPS